MCGGHGQEGGDPQGDPGRNRLVVDPEGEPRDEDDHGGRHVDGQDEEGQLSWWRDIEEEKLFWEIFIEVPGKDEVHLQAAVLP